MKNHEQKLSGSYYTPNETIQFMMRYLAEEGKQYRTLLEPSVGDGRFIDAFLANENIQHITAVELIKEKVDELKKKAYPDRVEVKQSDFLEFAWETDDEYSLIVGNPPYINIKNMDDDSLEKARKLCEKYELPKSLMKNMWVAFLLAAFSKLESGGIIFFVLPMEFLQVQYAESIRAFLEQHFSTIHILTFKEKMFPDIEQESCLVYLTNEQQVLPNIHFKLYEKLDSREPVRISVIKRNKPLRKWTNAILSDKEIDLLKVLKTKYSSIPEICDASPGIVTGANHDFILTSEQVKKLDCKHFVLPTIAKSNMLKGRLIVTQQVIDELAVENERIYLLNLSGVNEFFFSDELKAYLEAVGNQENASGTKLKERYKCKNRKPWYAVPIVRNGDIFFFKRYDKLPRVCVNETDAYTTDISYNMRLKRNYDKESLAFCFYNSLTLTLCEYYGRYYAGGVSELTPSEFKNLVIPYRKIEKEDINMLAKMFGENAEEEAIIHYVNSRTIDLDLEKEDIMSLNEIRRNLMNRRLL